MSTDADFSSSKSELSTMQVKIGVLEDVIRDLLNSVAVNLDDQEFSDRVIFAKARVTLDLFKEHRIR